MSKPSILFWIIAGLALVWNAMGAVNYIAQTNPDTVAKMPDAYQTIINARPAWATAAFALHVFAGTLGCLLLILRKRLSIVVLMLSVFSGMGFGLFISLLAGTGTLPISGVFGPLLSIAVVLSCVFLARRAALKNWLS